MRTNATNRERKSIIITPVHRHYYTGQNFLNNTKMQNHSAVMTMSKHQVMSFEDAMDRFFTL